VVGRGAYRAGIGRFKFKGVQETGMGWRKLGTRKEVGGQCRRSDGRKWEKWSNWNQINPNEKASELEKMGAENGGKWPNAERCGQKFWENCWTGENI